MEGNTKIWKDRGLFLAGTYGIPIPQTNPLHLQQSNEAPTLDSTITTSRILQPQLKPFYEVQLTLWAFDHLLTMAVGMRTISDGLIENVTLYRSYFWLLRWDVFPFATTYSVLFAASFSNDKSLRILGFICLPIALSIHLLLFLLSQWSIKLQCKLGNYIVKDVNQAEFVHVTTETNAGNDRIVRLCRQLGKRNEDIQQSVVVAGNTYLVPTEYFVFQKVTYSYDCEKNTFVRLEYPTAARLMR